MSVKTPSENQGYSLGVRLLKVVFSLYLVITLFITAVHMYNEFQQQKLRIDKNLITYQSIFGRSIATAWWNYDIEQLEATLNGVLGLADIAGVLLVDDKSKEIFRDGNAHSIAEGKDSWKNTFFQEFEVSYDNRVMGTLYLFSSQAIVIDQVKHNFLFIFINALIKSVVLWILFLWAFKKFLVRALDEFVLKMESTDFDNINSADANETPARHIGLESRELRRLDNVFSSLKERLHNSKNKLLTLNTNLEGIVANRTNMLERQSNLLEAMSSQARIGAWEYEIESNSLTWSTMTREIFDVDDDFTPSPESIEQFYPDDSMQKLKALQRNAVSNGEPWSEELIVTTRKGNKIWIATTGEAEFVNGKCLRLFGSVQDIDAAVSIKQDLVTAKQKAVAADVAKTEFLASMSHEIRTPMNGIMGMLHLLLASSLTDKQRKQAELSLSSADSLLLLLNEILDISKIEAGKLKLEQLDFSLKELLIQQDSFWKSSIEKKGLTLNLDISKVSHSNLNGDPNRVKQILSNLISNAEKFTAKGNISIKAATKTSGDKIKVSISVTDTGVGIKADKIETIFDVFSQEDSSTTRKYGGTGLGLTIVRELAEMMQGHVSVESQQDHGSTFHVDLLLKPATQQFSGNSDDESDHSAETVREPATPAQKGHILLVEDVKTNQLIAEAMIKANGFTCSIANDGVEAIQMLKQADSDYRIILMDCQMPRKDGYEATQDIRNGLAGSKHTKIPIIAMTAHAMKGDREKCIDVGMDDYLTKPFSPEEFQEKIQHWLK